MSVAVDSQLQPKRMRDASKKKSASMVPSGEANEQTESPLQNKRGSLSNNESKKKHGLVPSPYYVEGYNAYVNMWEKIYDLTHSKFYNKV